MRSLVFHGADGTPFRGCLWEPAAGGPARGLVLALHGMGSAAEEFAPLGEYLAARQWAVAAPNQRANGHDPVVARRGHGFDYAAYRADLLAFWDAVQAEGQGVAGSPVFLLGESMGGLLSVVYLTDPGFSRTCHGLILCAPVFALRRPTPAVVRLALRGLARLLPRAVISPAWFIQGKDAPVPVTRDVAYQEYLLRAPHRVARFTVSFTAGVDWLMQTARARAERIRLPLLLLGGEEDVFISPAQLQAWFERVASPDKTLRVFSGSLHLLLHELNTLEVLEVVSTWLESRVTVS